MSSVSCPHCGTKNPSASAYCAKCQRPLGRSASGTSSLAPASQVAQQILQKRPPVPVAEQAKTLPSAADVAANLMRKRAAEQAASSVERTVVERAPQPPPQRSRPAQPPPTQPTVTARPAAAPAPRPLEKTPSQARKAELDDDEANEPTLVFAAPKSLHDDPTRNNQRLDPPTQRTAVPQAPAPRAAAAPALPPPAMARDMPVQREPAAKPAPKRAPVPQPMGDRRGTPGNAVPGQVLREGALPPRRPAPQPPEASSHGFEYAAGWRLLLAHVVDIALITAVFWFFANIDAALSGPHGVQTTGMFDWISVHPGSTLRAGILTMLLGTTYHVVMLQLGGRTVGRLLAGTTLERRSGKPLNAFIITVRTVAGFVSLGLFGAGFFWSIVDRRGRAFHDIVSGTMVVRYRGA